MPANAVAPMPVQKTILNGLPSDSNAPVAKSPRSEADTLVSSYSIRAALKASHASFIKSIIPIRLKMILAVLFWTRNANPVNAINDQVVSPTSEPNCTNKAGRKPRAKPRRIVSAVIIPGGAQKAIPRIKEETASDIIFSIIT